MASIFVARMATRPHQWAVVTDRETFAMRAQKENNKRANTMYLGFVFKSQLLDGDMQSAQILSLAMAISFLAVIDCS